MARKKPGGHGSGERPDKPSEPAARNVPQILRQVELRAVADDRGAFASDDFGSFVVDPFDNTVTYRIPKSLTSARYEVALHGFAPPGWATEPLVRIPPGTQTGVWHYDEEQEKNILAGLAYLSVRPRTGKEPTLRAQIEPAVRAEPKLEDFVTVTALAGRCQTFISIPGLADDLPMEMEPAQVVLARTPARNAEGGRREQEIGCAIRVGGAHIPGIGRIEIEMYGSQNPGHIVSMRADSDFPARMTLDVRKRYVTPLGTFFSDREEFVAENIPRFPPFGVRFTPMQEIAPLREERTGEVFGTIRLGWLVPLCYLSAAEFPPRAIPVITPDVERNFPPLPPSKA